MCSQQDPTTVVSNHFVDSVVVHKGYCTTSSQHSFEELLPGISCLLGAVQSFGKFKNPKKSWVEWEVMTIRLLYPNVFIDGCVDKGGFDIPMNARKSGIRVVDDHEHPQRLRA